MAVSVPAGLAAAAVDSDGWPATSARVDVGGGELRWEATPPADPATAVRLELHPDVAEHLVG